MLLLNSSYDGMVNSGGENYMHERQAVASNYQISSGKVNNKRPLFMLGDHLSVKFVISHRGRNETSLQRWGFKLKIKPVYGSK